LGAGACRTRAEHVAPREKDSTTGAVLRIQSTSLRIYVKEIMARAVPWAVARRDSTGDQSRAPAWRARPVQGPGLTGGETFSTMQPQHECPVAACDLHAHHAL